MEIKTEKSNWVSTWRAILLGLRCSLKGESNTTPAEMVHGQTLRLPGDFFEKDNTVNVLPQTLVTQLKEKISKLTLALETHKSRNKPFVAPELKTATHVFVRHDAVRRPLQTPYDGPFKVVSREEKCFNVSINGNTKNISID